jgi:hypothetical protein
MTHEVQELGLNLPVDNDAPGADGARADDSENDRRNSVAAVAGDDDGGCEDGGEGVHK